MKILADIDGTLILENEEINSSSGFIEYLNKYHIEYLLATNSIKAPSEQKRRLSEIGIFIDESCILSPIMAINDFIREQGIKRVYAAGSDPEKAQIMAEIVLIEPELIILLDFEKSNYSFEELQKIYEFIQIGVPVISASYSPFYFSRGKKVLDTGAFTRLFEASSGRKIPVFGKPSSSYFSIAKRRLGENLWIIGDDCRTDILGAKKAGLNTILIRSGKYRKGDEEFSDPDMVVDDLMEIIPLMRGI